MGIFKSSRKLCGSLIVVAILSFFLCVSLSVICNIAFTEKSGYIANVYAADSKDGDQPITQYEYYFADGDDAKKEEYEKQGYVIETITLRSELSGVGKVVFYGVTQLLAIVIMLSFVASQLYEQGFKDSNMVRTGHQNSDMLKGLKIGFIANIPFYLTFAAAVVMSLGVLPQFRTFWYALFTGQFYPTIQFISTGAETLGDLNAVQLLLMLALQLIVPIAAEIAYIIGFKGINISDKIIYKKGQVK